MPRCFLWPVFYGNRFPQVNNKLTLSSSSPHAASVCCAAVLSFTNRSLSSGERDSCFFLCASASVCKILIFFQEEGTRAVSCVHQHHCIKFELFFWWERLLIVLLFSGMCDQNLCFLFGRERLSILFHCWGICFYILSEKTFSMLFDLSWCLSVKNFGN